MIAVIFEVEPYFETTADYLRIAGELRSQLELIDGFVSVERFESLSQTGKILSLSFWRDEAAVERWRNLPEHRRAQSAGRNGVFQYYRLRAAEVIRDYGMNDRAEVPADSAAAHSPGR